MKNRVVIGLLLAMISALPLLAEHGTCTSEELHSAAQQSSAQDASTSQPVNKRDTETHEPPVLEEHRSFWGKLNPFARKKHVRQQMQLLQTRVSELDELTASNTKMIKDVDARAQEGIQLASVKANEADQHAIDAGNKAQMAQQTATQANTRLSTVEQMVGNIDQYKASTQTEIRFRPGQSMLSKNAKSALDELATPLNHQRGYIVEVQGFSSGKGQAAIATSQKMADSVVRYLVLNLDIPVYRIFVVGMGNAPVQTGSADEQGKSKHMSGGRVEITVLRDELEQLSASSNPAEQAPHLDREPEIETFPWPPPTASARQVIPHDMLLKGSASPQFGDVDHKLTRALEENGYSERSYFRAPGGFVLVTRLEQIEEDGRSKKPPDRWSAKPQSSIEFTFSAFLRALFTAPPGYYRIIAFVVGNIPFSEEKREITAPEATAWLHSGAIALPESVAQSPFRPDVFCTALIYEFERQKDSDNARFLSPSHLDARTHLVKSGLWDSLGRTP